MDIVVLDGHTSNPGDLSWSAFKELGKVTVYDRTPPDLTAERIGNAEIVITNKTLITAEVLAACPNIKYIGTLATGYNAVDVAAATERKIPIANVPAYATAGVAQLVFALLLEICHNVGHHDTMVKLGKWQNSPDFCFWDYPLLLLNGKTMGIIGFGSTGRAVANIALAFGMKVIAHTRTVPKEKVPNVRFMTLDELLGKSDVISLHCPLHAETEGIINKDSIAKMKNDVILINTGRGPLIVETDLAEALSTGKIYAAGVDVVSKEPILPENPLLKAKNCFITPHIAWAPRDARIALLDIAAANIKAFIDGKPKNIVNL
ncbi:MAG: D-2-hydroxyacid dehydrogenase [Turicibacter sp.]|nr:D-2-hydroxyacid dehydrogenase [Turicibacter sp.]